MEQQQNTPEGWYECENGKHRYWDGSAWTTHGPLPNYKPWYRKWWFFAIIGVVVLGLVIGLFGPGGGEDKKATPVPTATATTETKDQQFERVWRSLPPTEYTVAEAQMMSKEICNRLEAGESVYTVWHQLLNAEFRPTDAGYFLGGAGSIYCPQFKDDIERELSRK